jgi:Protein of unknown function (DUF1236)
MKIPPVKELRYASIGLAVLLSFGAVEAGASPGGSMWITDGLTVAQRQEIWQGASKQAVKESLPASQKAALGQSLPNSVRLQPMPKEVSDEVPAVKSYDFAMLQAQLLIVDPASRKVIDIITQ